LRRRGGDCAPFSARQMSTNNPWRVRVVPPASHRFFGPR
jgi:hypothetical protein